MEPYQLTAHQLHAMLVKKEISAGEITRSFLKRVAEVDEKIRAYITVTKETALAAAREVDRKIGDGENIHPLAGIPVAIKDNICTKGIRTTCASNLLHNYIPPYDATVIEKLAAACAVMMGKANLDEFALGSTCESSAFFPTCNPWDLDRVPGGSSGGSAAAVAAGEALVSLGSDTGGSIRLPAAFCGVVGMKPTYGMVSRYGLVAFASSLDQIGPLTKDVTDCAQAMNVISGYDPMDSTSARQQVPDYTRFLKNDVQGLKIGIPVEYMDACMDAEIKKVVEKAAGELTALGAHIEETSLPHSKYAIPAYYFIALAEGASSLARYDGVRYGYRAKEAEDVTEMFKKTRSEGFGPEAKRRIMLGTYVLSPGCYQTYYQKSLQVRTLIKQDFETAFEKYDILLSPVNLMLPFKRGEEISDPLQMYLMNMCTLPMNLAGLPALSVPAGLVHGLPVGLQFIGRPFGEGSILQAAYTFEQHTGHIYKKPGL